VPVSVQRWLHHALDAVLLLVAGLQVYEIAVVWWPRLHYGYDLEWMEGATLISGLRALQGLPFYTEPQLDYIPFIYPPVYAWLLGALGHVFPFGYALGRSVSIAGTLAACGALLYGARQAGVRWPLAVGCAVLFLGTYEDSGTFFDLVRIDGLAMGLLAWALVVALGPKRWHPVVGGLLLAAAFMTKHHAAIFGFPMGLVLWRRDGWRRAATFAAAALIPALLFTIVLEITTHGLFLVYLLEVPASHGMVRERLLPSVHVTWTPFHVTTGGAMMECLEAAPLLWLWAVVRPGWLRGRSGNWWGAVSLVALVTASLMRGHTGGYVNVLMPMMWVQALWPALFVAADPRRWVAPAVTALVALQIWQGRGELAREVPTEEDRRNAAALIDELRELPEPLLIPHAPYYAVLAGKEPSISLICLWDINHEGGPFFADVGRIRRAIEHSRWKTVVVPDDKLGYGLKEGYTRARNLRSKPFGTRTGWSVRLRQVWVPRGDGG
jgi:hypothetical protein